MAKQPELPEWYLNPPDYNKSETANAQIGFLARSIRIIMEKGCELDRQALAAQIARALKRSMKPEFFAFYAGKIATTAAMGLHMDQTCCVWAAPPAGCYWAKANLCSECQSKRLDQYEH